jgi:hypothetical protein
MKTTSYKDHIEQCMDALEKSLPVDGPEGPVDLLAASMIVYETVRNSWPTLSAQEVALEVATQVTILLSLQNLINKGFAEKYVNPDGKIIYRQFQSAQ